FGVPQPAEHHPEIDTGVHTMLVLAQAARLSSDPEVRFAALVHDLGKGTTPKEEWPRHIAHEARGVPLVKALCKRLRIPNHFRDLALLVTEFHLHYHRAAELRPETLLKLLRRTDALRRPERFEQFILACEADSRGRWGFEDAHFEQPGILRRVRDAAAAVDSRELCEQGLEGKALGEALQARQLEAIRAVQQAATD
ncbi:MAG TPA: HD domain-containing protein, partial [Chromatiales bacterium]|nr:HD domain-containing protein [Chromatiales bacterium]HEX22108.1 HD domain-containing protein [Chromatiales bacterium]